MISSHRVFRNVFSVLLSEVFSRILAFIVTLYVARGLGTESLGMLSFAMSFVMLSAVFSDMGISRFTIREVAREHGRAQQLLPAAFSVKLGLAVLTAAVLLLVSTQIQKGPEQTLYLRILVVWLFFDSMNLLLRGVFTAWERMEYVGALKVVEKLLFFLLFLLVLYLPLGQQRLLGVVVLYPVSVLAAFVVGLVLLARRGLRLLVWPSWRSVRSILGGGWPFAGSLVLASVYLYSDTLMLSYWKGDAVTGLYNASYKLFITFYALQALLAEVYFPTFSRLIREDFEHFLRFGRRVARVLFAFVPPLVAGCLVLAPQGIELIYGPQYEGSVTSFRILSLDLLVRACLSITGVVLLAGKRERRFMLAIGIGALMNLLLNVVLIPAHSLDGAAAATVISEILVLAAMAYWSRQVARIAWVSSLLRASAAAVAMALLLLALPAWPLSAKVALGIVAYLAIFAALGGIRKQDGEFVLSMIRGGK